MSRVVLRGRFPGQSFTNNWGHLPRSPEAFSTEAALRHLAGGENLIIVWHSASEVLVDALQNGTAPGEALQRWATFIEDVLAVFRANRSRVILVANTALSTVGALPAELERDLGQLGSLASPTTSEIPEPIEVMANLMTASLPELRHVFEELQTSSIAPAPQSFDLAMLDSIVVRMAMQGDDQFQTGKSRPALEAENSLLLEQLALLQSTLDTFHETRAHLLSDLGSERSARISAEAELEGNRGLATGTIGL